MSVPTLPQPPPPTHREALGSLPEFPHGVPEDRLARARDFLRESYALVESFHRDGAAGLSTCRLLSAVTDKLVLGLFQELAAELHAPPGL
ncbi:MAG TPA: hypothetical protein VLQ93_17520, partial [Myxococcaceae bacterium]|nr:hypothetical protein [Myxococcaceae bacterium]